MGEERRVGADVALWLTVKLQEHMYALDCTHVTSIFEIKQGVKPVADVDESILGVLDFRGGLLPVVDLRKRFGMQTMQEEMAEFESMLALRKQDHVNWVHALEHSIHTNEPFTLATDPHRCKFGQWYDHYQPKSLVVKRYFDQINRPHIRLHQSALLCFATEDAAERQRILEKESEPAMHQVLSCIDSALEAYKGCHRRMCVAVSYGKMQLGMLVDEILQTGQLEDIHEVGQMAKNPSVHAAAHQPDGTAILLIDTPQILAEVERMPGLQKILKL